MQKIANYVFLFIITLSFSLGGCVSWFPTPSEIAEGTTKYNPWSLVGINTKDLRSDQAFKKEQLFPLPYDAAFDRVVLTLKQQNLIIYEKDKWGKYIIAMGFKKQVDTTRVGIFFKSVDTNQTKITLSALSLTTLDKASVIIFKGLEDAPASQ